MLTEYGKSLLQSPPATNPDSSEAPSVPTQRKRTAFPEYYIPYDDRMDVEALMRIQEHLQQSITGK